jgi:hypothetical protein
MVPIWPYDVPSSESHPIAQFRHAFEFVGLKLGVQIAAVVEVDRHRVDVTARPRRHRQPAEDAKALLHPLHDVQKAPTVRHATRSCQRLQRGFAFRAENPGALTAQLGASRDYRPFVKRNVAIRGLRRRGLRIETRSFHHGRHHFQRGAGLRTSARHT